VVATACYVARTFGVRSAMPMFEARRLCPHAEVVRPDMAKYARAGREVRAMMLDLTPLVEPLSIDEAFLDLTGTERLHGMPPAKALARFARKVEQKIGITVSIGLSQNKFSPRSRPISTSRAAFRARRRRGGGVPRAQAGNLHLGRRQGHGASLTREGFRTIADLQRADETALMRRFETEGLRLARLSRGIDARTVNPNARPRACRRRRRSPRTSPRSGRWSGICGS